MNKAIIMGRLTRDPELRQTNNNNTVASFTVAVDRRFKNANGDREADFINCVAWRKTAEHIAQYYVKGKPIIVVGSIQTRSWEDQQGQKRYATEVVADEVYFTINDTKAGGQTKSDGYLDERTDSVVSVDAGTLPFDL